MSLLHHCKCALIASAFATAAICHADPIDPNFGQFHYGFDRLFWGGKDLYALAATVDAAGNIYVAGNLDDGTSDPFVYSQTSDGVDRAYGDISVAANTAFAGLANYATSATVDDHGRVMIGGYITLPLDTCPDGSPTTSYAYATRFNTDGSLDTTFGSSGMFAGSSFIRLPCAYPYQTEIGLQSSGKIVLATTAWPNDRSSAYILVARLSADGSTDGGFGSAGLVTLDTAAADEDLILAGFSVTPSNALAVAGIRRSKMTYEATNDVFKLTADGELDTTFNKSGIYHFAPTTSVSVSSLAINSLDQLYFAAADVNDGNFSVTKLRSDGTLDSGFGIDGSATFVVGGYSSAPQKILFDSRGRLNVFGYANDWEYDPGEIFLLHLNEDGTMNHSVGSAGDYEQSCGLFQCSLRGAFIDLNGRPTITTYTSDETILFRYDELFGAGFD